MNEIPSEISDEERIVRTIFSPYHIDKNKKKLKPGAFRPPSGSNEISVDRFDYTSIDACKAKGKLMNGINKSFTGIALSSAEEVKSISGVTIVASPSRKNRCHADISYDFVLKKGEECSPENLFKIKQLTKQFKLYMDRDPDSDHWCGDEIK
ncbi:MAG: hypothetical protein R3Y59_09735 [bacterium]